MQQEDMARITGRDPIQPADKKNFPFLSVITFAVETPFFSKSQGTKNIYLTKRNS
jgi:hypothetical protein